jgi:gliding motility-associated protein GldM
MALPQEPRQKMINIMYLVLTALLALNVSAEILHAFKTVQTSLDNASTIIEQKNSGLLKSLQEKLTDEKTRAKATIWKPKADKVKQLSDDINTYIEELKLELKKEAGLKTVDGKEEFSEENLDAATRLLVEKAPTGKDKGIELETKLKAYKQALIDIDPELAKEIGSSLPLDLSIPPTNNSAAKDNWAYSYFHMTPAIAALTIMSKFQNDIKNCEAQMIDACHRKVGEVTFIIDSYNPFAGTNSQYFMPGQELVINAGVSASSKAQAPKVYIDGTLASINPATNVAEAKFAVGGPGSYAKKVRVEYVNQATGKPETKEIEVKYTVGSPTGVHISAEKLNVLYVGLDNEISISGGSKGAEAIQASASAGELKKSGPGVYTINPESIGSGNITITASVDGKPTTKQFKVRNVPPPTPMVAGNAGGKMSANQFKASQGVSAILKDFLYDGVKYTVAGYIFVCTGKGFENGAQFTQVNGAYYNSEASRIKEMCKPGSSVIISDIYVEGPGGKRKLDGTLAFNLTP